MKIGKKSNPDASTGPQSNSFPRRRATLGSHEDKIASLTSNTQRNLSLNAGDDDEDSTATVHRNISLSLTNLHQATDSPKQVRFAPLPPRRSPTSPPASSSNNRRGTSKIKTKGFRRDYSLGDVARCSSHMIIESTPEQAFQSINTLTNRDFVFIKRSDGSFSYSIVACRTLEPSTKKNDSIDNGASLSDVSPRSTSETLEECMIFVLNETGSTLKLWKHEWIQYVRLVSMEGLIRHRRHPRRRNSVPGDDGQRSRYNNRDPSWSPPNIISFVVPAANSGSNHADENDDISR